jgi:hypothetical protein
MAYIEAETGYPKFADFRLIGGTYGWMGLCVVCCIHARCCTKTDLLCRQSKGRAPLSCKTRPSRLTRILAPVPRFKLPTDLILKDDPTTP